MVNNPGYGPKPEDDQEEEIFAGFMKNFTRQRRWTLIIVLAILLIGTVSSLTGRRTSITTQLNDTTLGVAGVTENTIFIEYPDIVSVELVDTFDYGECLDGVDTDAYKDGQFINDALGEYRACMAAGDTDAVVIGTNDGYFAVNTGTEKKTAKLYEELKEMIESA